LAILNGFVVAIYAPMFYAIRGRRADVARAAVLLVVGATHIVWCVGLTAAAARFLVGPLSNGSDSSILVVTTGVVLGAAVGLCSRTWWVFAGMLVASGAAALASVWQGVWPGSDIGLIAAPLHVALATLLFADTRAMLSGVRLPLPTATRLAMLELPQ
jgi:hypothetical protein